MPAMCGDEEGSRKDAKTQRCGGLRCCVFLGVSASWRESSDFLALFVILSRLGEDLGCLQCVERGRVHAKTLRRKGAEGEDSVCSLASLRLGVSLLRRLPFRSALFQAAPT